MTDKKAVSITVPSKDPKKDKKDGDKDKDKKEVTTLDGVGGGGGDADKKKKKGTTKGGKDILEPEELSEEDKALKEGLELAVTRVDDSEPGIGEFWLILPPLSPHRRCCGDRYNNQPLSPLVPSSPRMMVSFWWRLGRIVALAHSYMCV